MPALTAINVAPTADPGSTTEGPVAPGDTLFAVDLAQAGEDSLVLPAQDDQALRPLTTDPTMPDLAALLSAILTPHQASTQQVEAFLSAGGDPDLAAAMLASMAPGLPPAGQPGSDATAAAALAVVPTLAALSSAAVVAANPPGATSGPPATTHSALPLPMVPGNAPDAASRIAPPATVAPTSTVTAPAFAPTAAAGAVPTAPAPLALMPSVPATANSLGLAMAPPLLDAPVPLSINPAGQVAPTAPMTAVVSALAPADPGALVSAPPAIAAPVQHGPVVTDGASATPMAEAVAPTAAALPSQPAAMTTTIPPAVQPKRSGAAKAVDTPLAPAPAQVQDPAILPGLVAVAPVTKLAPTEPETPADPSTPTLAAVTPDQVVSVGPMPASTSLPARGLGKQTQGELALMHGGDAPVSATTREVPSMTPPATTTTATTVPVLAAPLAGARSGMTADGNPLERAVARQVSQALVRTQPNGEKRMVLRLTPPELGTVRIELTERDGTLSARLYADDQGVRQALERLLPQIRHDLRGQDATIRTVELGDGRPDRQNNDGQSSQQQRRDDPAWNQAQDRPRRDGPAFSLDGPAPTAPSAPTARPARSLGGTITAATVDATA